MTRSVILKSTSMLALAACFSTLAHGQDIETAATDGGEPDELRADTITVTTRKRAEDIQDIPVAVTAFDRSVIEDFLIDSQEDLESLIVGAEFIGDNGDPFANEIIIRGGGVGRQLNVDSGTGLYFNGISIQGGNIGGRGLTRVDLFDIERIEVIKGPQGALYGRNALGGAINVISRRPSLEEVTGRLAATVADNEGYGVEGAVDLPVVTDVFGIRLAGDYYNQDEGFYFNPFLNTFTDARDELNLRALALWQVAPGWEATFQADYFDSEREGNTRFSANVVDDPFNWSQDDLPRATREIENYQSTLRGDLGWADLDLIVNYRTREGTRFRDDDNGVAVSPFDPTAQIPCIPAMMGMFAANQRCSQLVTNDFEKLSFEGRLSGQADRLDWIAGVDAFESEDFWEQDATGRGTGSFSVDLSNDTTSWSVFGGVEHAFTDRFSAGAELRQSYESKDLQSLAFLTEPPVAGLVVIDSDFSEDFDYTTWAVYASYDVSAALLLYSRVGSGFRSGGLNTDGRDNVDPATGEVVEVPDFFDPERAVSYEAGFKSTLMDGDFLVNGSVFFIEYEDFISNRNNGLAGLDRVSYVTNIGDSEVTGAELELQGRLAGEDRGFRLDWSAAASYLDGDIVNPVFPQDEGNKVSRVPEWSWSGRLRASVPAFDGFRAYGTLAYSGQSGGFQTFNNNVPLPEPNVFNASLGLRDGRWNLQFTVTNLFDEDEPIAFENGPNAESVARNPRSWRLSLTRRFGG